MADQTAQRLQRPQQQRIVRARTQPILLSDAWGEQKGRNVMYHVMGTRGTEYQVGVIEGAQGELKWQCSCPDFQNRQSPCKHVYFIAINVWHMNDDELLRLVPACVEEKLAERQKRIQEQIESSVGRKPVEGDCPVCMESLSEGNVLYCQGQCGNNVHEHCIRTLEKFQRRVSCPLCRAKWIF